MPRTEPVAARRKPSPPAHAGSGPQALLVCGAVRRASEKGLSSPFFPLSCVCNPRSKRKKYLQFRSPLKRRRWGREDGRGWDRAWWWKEKQGWEGKAGRGKVGGDGGGTALPPDSGLNPSHPLSLSSASSASSCPWKAPSTH